MTTDTHSDRRRWLALYALCAGMLMIVLDATVVNVALPSIQKDLGFSTSTLAWVVNAYLIAFGGLLLLAGRIGDLLGHKNVFMVGLLVFTLASIACGISQSQEMLVISRFVQGVGGALTSAVILGMIFRMFPEPREQAKAIGVYAFVASAGGSVGLLAGGVLTQSISWHWIFFVNVPIALITAVLCQRLLTRDKGIGFDKGADIPGAALITGALMLGVYTIVQPAAVNGWTSSQALILGAVTIMLVLLFIWREASAKTPLVPLRIFKSRNITGANIVQVLTIAGLFGMFFLGALYLQRVLGYDALETGAAFLPMTIVMGTLSIRYSEKLIMRFGGKTMLFPGLAMFAISLIWFSQAPVDGNYWINVFPVMILLGFGAGLAFPSLVSLAMSGAKPEEAGLASGIVNTSAQAGGALGLAVLATISASTTWDLLHEGKSPDEALVGGYHVAFLIGAGLVILAIVVAALVIEKVEMPEMHGAGGDGHAPDPRGETDGGFAPDASLLGEFGLQHGHPNGDVVAAEITPKNE